MLDGLFTSPRALARARACWLREAINDFLAHLSAQRFNRNTLRVCCYRLLAFSEFTASKGVCQVALLPQWIDPFAAHIDAQAPHRRTTRRALTRFVHFLQAKQLIPQPPPAPPAPHHQLLDDYARWLSEQRGLCRDSIVLMRRPCRAFLDFVTAEGVADLLRLPPEVIHRFVICQGKRYCRRTLRSRCQTLRGFLSFLHRRGVVAAFLVGFCSGVACMTKFGIYGVIGGVAFGLYALMIAWSLKFSDMDAEHWKAFGRGAMASHALLMILLALALISALGRP